LSSRFLKEIGEILEIQDIVEREDDVLISIVAHPTGVAIKNVNYFELVKFLYKNEFLSSIFYIDCECIRGGYLTCQAERNFGRCYNCGKRIYLDGYFK
jgi:hypothetical protein